MPRQAKPYKEHGWWVSRPFGEFWRLCPETEKFRNAKDMLDERLRERKQENERCGGRTPPRLTVSEMFVLFLKATEVEKSHATFLDYRRWCVEFAKKYGSKLARDIYKFDIQQFKQHMLTATWSRNGGQPQLYKPKSVNHALIAVKRAFNWAIENELLPEGRNLFAKAKLLRCKGRQRVATEEEYQALLSHCTDEHFRDVLIAMRFSSARPGDIRRLSWPMVKWDRHCWIFTEHKTSETAEEFKPRLIGMNGIVEELLRARLAKYGTGKMVFTNRAGNPWTKDSLGHRMRNLREQTGIRPDERGEEFVLYTNRHSFLTAGAMNPGITETLLSEIAGHTDPRTTRRYTHLANQVVVDGGRRIADSMSSQSQ